MERAPQDSQWAELGNGAKGHGEIVCATNMAIMRHMSHKVKQRASISLVKRLLLQRGLGTAKVPRMPMRDDRAPRHYRQWGQVWHSDTDLTIGSVERKRDFRRAATAGLKAEFVSECQT